AVVNVAGVTTTTDDGKSYTRSDLTKSVGVKGDGKNIRTSTAANGDVQVKLADDIQVNSVAIHNGPTINQQGINANNTRITNVQDGVAPTDAVNVRQLNQQGNIINQRIDNLADNVKKNKKRNDAGIASTAAMANIPQVMLAGKSGVGVGVGHRSGQNAIAVGYSRASDNAKHIIKLSAGLDTQSKATFGAGYMYQW
ncbi:YadA-like family protein, partial [Actinobacillus porcinus]|uniref:YadA family autotransporter adhesin n=1 Tax=Actinobacillus porcinus TaxID=51048 RepID=UPI002A90A87D